MTGSAISIGPVPRHDREAFAAELSELERDVTYPIGDDRFRIDHGDHYFAFFERLGEVHVLGAWQANEVVGGMVVVHRAPQGPRPECWYLCDLKVRPGTDAGARLLSNLESVAGPTMVGGYGISMNPPGRPNPLRTVVHRLVQGPFTFTDLNLYQLDAEQARAIEPEVVALRGALRFVDLTEIKALILESTGMPMRVLHADYSGSPSKYATPPLPSFVHMFCAPEDDPLDAILQQRISGPMARATILARGMEECDWTWVTTGEI